MDDSQGIWYTHRGNKMKTYLLIFIIVIALFFGGLMWEILSWNECLKAHEWWYCLRILGK